MAKEKSMDPESELSNVMRRFQNLAPQCSVAKRALGIPQLAPQEKQIGILKHEMKETRLCIKLARQGMHALRDNTVKTGIQRSILDYEDLNAEVKDESLQKIELDLLNYLTKKVIADLSKNCHSETGEQAHHAYALNSLRRMENRLDMAIKRFCIVNTENMEIRQQIDILLVERNSFNVIWNKTIKKLVKGKEFLHDILEIASKTFDSRDEACRMLDTLKWKGLHQLNKDIAEMQSYDSELNHLAKLEEFLRVKGSTRLCESDEKEEAKRLEDVARCELEIGKYDDMLEEIFRFSGTESVATIVKRFKTKELENFSMFVLLCQVLQESIFLKTELEIFKQRILDQHDINQARGEKQDKRIADLTQQLQIQQKRCQDKLQLNMAADATFLKVLKDLDDLIRITKCDTAPLMRLLGNHLEVTKWNVRRFLNILECEVKSLLQVAYGAIKPPAPTPKTKGAPPPLTKLVADPKFTVIRPNKIENMVPYQPCAYCVEDYMMNLVFETPAVPANKEYVEKIFRLEDVNTKFGIYTLTIPAKRHPFKGGND